MIHRAAKGRTTTGEALDGTRRTGRFRHVAFADAIDGAARAVNLATAGQPELDGKLNEDDGAFLEWLFQQAGLDVQNYRRETLARRLPACLRKLKVSHVHLARALLLNQPELVPEALSAILIGVTGFFRDESVFSELANRVLPELSQRKLPMRIWSAACSDGSELYSVAILLAEMNVSEDVELLGTDCRSEAIRAAAHGVYELSAMRGVSAERMAKHFHRVTALGSLSGGLSDKVSQTARLTGWRVNEGLRAFTCWQTADVVSTSEPGMWDLILFRNAAMYFRGESADFLYQRLSTVLAPGGYLVLGKAEKPTGVVGLSSLGHCLYRRSS